MNTGRYQPYQPSEEQIRKAIHLQVMARRNPKTVTYPEGWIPTTQLDKFVAQNLIMDMPIRKILKLFPNFNIGFVKKVYEA
jgi:hypothetical protein